MSRLEPRVVMVVTDPGARAARLVDELNRRAGRVVAIHEVRTRPSHFERPRAG